MVINGGDLMATTVRGDLTATASRVDLTATTDHTTTLGSITGGVHKEWREFNKI